MEQVKTSLNNIPPLIPMNSNSLLFLSLILILSSAANLQLPLPPSSIPAPKISWSYIFKKNTTSADHDHGCTKEKDAGVVKETKKREKNNGAAELNINICRSAGNGTSWVSRGVSTAPCSRSSSTKTNRNRNRGGVHLGRSGPVWQLRAERLGFES